jgi:DNA-binding CsgD family transcriptional regulator
MNTATLVLDGAARRRVAHATTVVAAPPPSAALSVSLLDELPFGLILIDRTFRVTLANALARTMVERGDCMSLTGERLRFLDAATAHRFASAAAQVMGTDGSGTSAQGAAFRVGRSHGAPDYLASLKRFCVFDECVSVGSAYCVQLVDAHARRSIAPRVLRQLHGLTATEAVVAARLYAGMSLQEAALSLSISVHTIKTHLKRIFEKCAVRSQVELVRLMEFGPHCD